MFADFCMKTLEQIHEHIWLSCSALTGLLGGDSIKSLSEEGCANWVTDTVRLDLTLCLLGNQFSLCYPFLKQHKREDGGYQPSAFSGAQDIINYVYGSCKKKKGM